ncbi:hypothetical protein [Micromonospora globbae]|uniref:hypothetical protein n=1 Tax=Micromonospora globbae TaxID=1894969 RepID=UPI00342FD68F
MIRLHGRLYGTRRQIAAALGPDVTVDMVRNWSRLDRQVRCPDCTHLDPATTTRPCDHPLRLSTYMVGGRAYHPWDEATAIEAVVFLSPLGRPRRLDAPIMTAA